MALEGIVTLIKRLTKWDYLQGLWVPFLNTELLWTVPVGWSGQKLPGFPTWSCTSTNSNICPNQLISTDTNGLSSLAIVEPAINDLLLQQGPSAPLSTTAILITYVLILLS